MFKENVLFIWGKEQVELMDLHKLALTTPPAMVSLDYSEEVSNIVFTVDASLKA